jgi:hypothetical protein
MKEREYFHFFFNLSDEREKILISLICLMKEGEIFDFSLICLMKERIF